MAGKTPPTTKTIHCNNCRRTTRHRLVKRIEGDTDSEVIDGEFSIDWRTTFDVFQCNGCLEPLLRRIYEFSEYDYPEIRYFPPRISRHPPTWVHQLPNELKSLLEEIYRALDADNYRLPLMGARTLVDIVMSEKLGGDAGPFSEKLKQLQVKGYVSIRNTEILEAALDAGSAAAHRGYAPQPKELNIVMDIVENLLQAVYVLQEAAQELKKSTPPRPAKKAKP